MATAGEDNSVTLNSVEQNFLAKSDRFARYPGEQIQIIEVNNQLELGQLTALSFIKWIEENPQGVIAIAVGKTSSSFPKYLRWYKDHWHEAAVQKQLRVYGIQSSKFPCGKSLKFVQVAEFYPMTPQHVTSFRHYIEENYLSIFDIPEENRLLIDLSRGILKNKGANVVFRDGKVDLSLLYRKPRNHAEGWQKQALKEASDYCDEYEKQIAKWGGIGLYIGRIGIDGHIAFNMPGASFKSVTRLERLSDATAAQIDEDLAGMTQTRYKVMMTIGLSTITKNPDVKIIVLGAGANKADLVRAAVEQPSETEVPFSILQKYPNTRLYLTHAASQKLSARYLADIQKGLKGAGRDQVLSQVAADIALKEQTPLLLLTRKQLKKYPEGKLFLEALGESWNQKLQAVHNQLATVLQNGVAAKQNNKFIHIAPQQDDLLLTYYAALSRTFSQNHHQFVYLRDGAHQVADDYLLEIIEQVDEWWLNKVKNDIFKVPYAALLKKFAVAYRKEDKSAIKNIETIIILKKMTEIYQLKNVKALKAKIRWLKDEYYPQKAYDDWDMDEMWRLKAEIRQAEVDRLWHLKGVPLEKISHLQAKISALDYAHLFEVNPQEKQQLLKLCLEMHPDVVTVVDNSVAEGTDIHFLVMQLIAEVLDNYAPKEDLMVWGYRSSGQHYRFGESNLIIPVTRKELKDKKRLFYHCFASQKNVMGGCPTKEYDSASRSTLTQKKHLQELKVLLGESFFTTHPDPQIKNASGIVLLRQMKLTEFLAHATVVKHEMGHFNT